MKALLVFALLLAVIGILRAACRPDLELLSVWAACALWIVVAWVKTSELERKP